jgi:pilus assembly protein CpaF
MEDVVFSQIDFGLLMPLLEDDDVTDISYSNNGQLWVKTLSQGVQPRHIDGLTNEVIEKLAFQCSNVMGKTFNMAHPFLDAESAELRLNFVHNSIATNGVALLIRKTPAKIRLNKEKLIQEDYVSTKLHDFLITCVQGHCNILVSGETGSGKTELVKYLASHTREDEKIITIEDTLELHLDKIYPNRDIVAMKTNNIASYSDVLVTCMRQNPRWILLSEVRSAEAVMAVRNSISSGHNILSTIHSDKASSIPMRLYSLLESSQEIDQFLKSIHRYVQIGIHVKGFFSKQYGRFQREITQVCEFYVDDEANEAKVNVLYQRDLAGNETYNNPTEHLIDYMASQGVEMRPDPFVPIDNTLKETTDDVVVSDANVVQVEAQQAAPEATPAPEVAQPAQPEPVQQVQPEVAQPAQQEPVQEPQPAAQAQIVVEAPAAQAVEQPAQVSSLEIVEI